MRSMRGLTVAHEIHLCLRLWAGDRGCSGGNRILEKLATGSVRSNSTERGFTL